MIVVSAVVKGGIVEMERREIDQRSLTGDCWSIQFQGLKACERCAYRNTKKCGGGATLISLGGKNIIRRTRK